MARKAAVAVAQVETDLARIDEEHEPMKFDVLPALTPPEEVAKAAVAEPFPVSDNISEPEATAKTALMAHVCKHDTQKNLTNALVFANEYAIAQMSRKDGRQDTSPEQVIERAKVYAQFLNDQVS